MKDNMALSINNWPYDDTNEEDVLSPKKEQVGGDHYKKYPIQPFEYNQKNGLRYCEGNVVKYVTRHRDKYGKEDLLKAIHYINLLIELEYGPSSTKKYLPLE